MWTYNHYEDYLQHRLVDGRRVKYVAKVPLGGDKFRYFYTMPDYKAYLSSKKTAAPTVKKTLAPVKKTQAPTAYDKPSVKNAPASSPKQTTAKPSVAKTTVPSTPKVKPSSGSLLRATNTSKSNSVADKLRDIDPKTKDVVDKAAKAVAFLAGGRYGNDSVLAAGINALVEKFREPQQFQKLNELPKQTKTRSKDQDQELVNPDYNSAEMRYSMNCSYCSATWDLRRRGYEVEARPYTNEYDTDLAEIASWYKDTTTEDFSGFAVGEYSSSDRAAAIQVLGEDMLSQGEGAYGNFVMYWTGGAGHSVVWSVENGKVMIRDTQLNTVDTWEDYMRVHEPYMDIYCYLRTDNRELSPSILEVCRERRVW